ncbi:hypothetical protein [Anaerosporobacter faecicola]|uniref:hypothetical protein n=1 Tax=Anaerosporobacter faecicola TaxID=2718714 RepID=UPI00143CB665|nr:hypothetical protein [Anaerosporobacter faecicola]
MAKRYARLNWNSTSTYVSPDNLNKMDKGIDDCDNAIETLNTQVNTLNNNLMNESTKDFVVSDFSLSSIIQLDNCYAQRKGKHINLRLTFYNNAIIPYNTSIITLPQLYRPAKPVKTFFASNNSVINYATVGTDGTVKCDGDIAINVWSFIYISY